MTPGLLSIDLKGSLQNPAWSHDGRYISFTRFREGYNTGPSDIFVYDTRLKNTKPLVSDGYQNVSQPGASWSKEGWLIYSSDTTGHDELWTTNLTQHPETVTHRSDKMAYEPSWACDKSIVFESHNLDQEDHGSIWLIRFRTGKYQQLTSNKYDCRQPNCSPVRNVIVYQRKTKQWNLCLHDLDTNDSIDITSHLPGDKTDATFSPDGKYILFSGQAPGQERDTLLIMPVSGGVPAPVTDHEGYLGAASWSPNGIVAEASDTDPDGGPGTKLVILPVPKRFQ